MTEIAAAATTMLTLAAVIGLAFHVVHRLGRRSARLSERAVTWATNLGVSAVLSFVISLVMTTVNVGLTVAFPAAFLTSFLLGLAVATPTAYFTFPWVSRLMKPLAEPASTDPTLRAESGQGAVRNQSVKRGPTSSTASSGTSAPRRNARP